jgi:hypothetical protein
MKMVKEKRKKRTSKSKKRQSKTLLNLRKKNDGD